MADLQFTAADRAWLREMDRAMSTPAHPVVAMDMYLAAIASNDYITGENHVMRKERQRLWLEQQKLRARMEKWRLAALACAGLAVGLAVSLWEVCE